MSKHLDPERAARLAEEARRAEAAADSDPDAPLPADAVISWPNRSRMLTLRLRESEYEAIRRAAEAAHMPASTLARALLLAKLEERQVS